MGLGIPWLDLAMKYYVINLDRRPDRLTRMTHLAQSKGFAFERVAACDAAQPSALERIGRLPKDGPTGRLSQQTLACTVSHFLA